MIEYLPPEHPTRYRVRSLDLATGQVSLPVSLRDKATPVDESMAGTSRTQVYAASSDLLFTLYQPAPADPAATETWDYGFVHTLAPSWGGVWCIDLPERLGLEAGNGTLALSPDERTLYVATSAGQIGEIPADDITRLEVERAADLGVAGDERPVMAAGSERLWLALGRELLIVDPIELSVVGRAQLPSPVTAMALGVAGRELVTADADHLRRWTVDGAGQVIESPAAAIALPAGLGTVSRIVLP